MRERRPATCSQLNRSLPYSTGGVQGVRTKLVPNHLLSVLVRRPDTQDCTKHGAAKAIVATACKIARIVYHILKDKRTYVDPGVTSDANRYKEHMLKNLSPKLPVRHEARPGHYLNRMGSFLAGRPQLALTQQF